MSDAPFPIQPRYTAIAIAYKNPDGSLIADDVLPRIQPIGGEPFKWLKYNRSEGFRVPNTMVGRKGVPQEIEFGATEETASTQDYALDDFIPHKDVQAAEASAAAGGPRYDPRAHAIEYIMNLIELDREVRVAGIVFDRDTYPASNREVLAPADQFDAYDTSDPIGVIEDAKQQTLGYEPNTMVMGNVVWTKIRRHPQIVKAVRPSSSSGEGIVSRQEFAELFEIERFLVGKALFDTTRKGQDPNLQPAWGPHIALFYHNPNANTQRGVTFGLTVPRATRIAGSIPDQKRGMEGGYTVRAGEALKELILAPDVGYLIENAV